MKKIILIKLFFILFSNIFAQELYVVMVNNLRIRQAQDLTSKIITKVQIGEIVTLIKTGNQIEIDNIKSNWLYVSTKSKIKGWIFGGYLSKLVKIKKDNYEIEYPEKWIFREEDSPTFTYLQIASFDSLKNSNYIHGYIPSDQGKVEIYIHKNVKKDLDNWLKDFDNYNNRNELEKIENGVKIKIKNKFMGDFEYIYKLNNNTGLIITYFPTNTIYKKICENIINSFKYKEYNQK